MLHACVYTSTGTALQWVNELRYPDVFVIRSRTFKCSVDNAKKSFYRSARNVNKTFFQDQDQDFCFKTKTKTKTSEIFQDQDQDQAFLLKTKTKTLHLKTKTKTKTFTQCQVIQRQLQTMQLTEHWSNVVKSTTAAYSQKYQLTGNFLNKYTNRYMQ